MELGARGKEPGAKGLEWVTKYYTHQLS